MAYQPTQQGPQQPQKYPFVGKAYQYWGEQPGFVYDPYRDSYTPDPKQRQEYLENSGIAQKQPKQPGLGTVLGSTVGLAGAVTIGQQLGKGIGETAGNAIGGVGSSTPSTAPTNAPASAPAAGSSSGGMMQGATSAPPPAAAPQASSNAGSASGGMIQGNNSGAPATPNLVSVAPVVEVGSTTMPDGSPGTLMSDGGKVGQNGQIISASGEPVGSVSGQALAGLQVAGGAAQIYSGYRQYKAGEKLGGAANMAGGAFSAAAGAQALAAGGTAGSLASYVPGVGWVVAGAQIGQQMLNDKGASEDRAAAAQYEAQKASLLFIPGYGWVAYAALAAADALTKGKAGKAIMGFNKKMDDNVINKIDFGIKKSLDKKLFHQSTAGVQQMHSGQLMAQSDDPTWQNYVAGMRQGMDGSPDDPENPFGDTKGNKYRTWDDYKKGGLDAANLTGVYGNIDAFKPDYAEKAGVPNWSQLTFEQQRAVTQRLIDEDMYSSKKGEVVIGDKEKARRIYEGMVKSFTIAPPAGQPGAALAPQRPGMAPLQPGQTPQSTAGAVSNGMIAPTPQTPQRSSTRSPGIGRDGRRIQY